MIPSLGETELSSAGKQLNMGEPSQGVRIFSSGLDTQNSTPFFRNNAL